MGLDSYRLCPTSFYQCSASLAATCSSDVLSAPSAGPLIETNCWDLKRMHPDIINLRDLLSPVSVPLTLPPPGRFCRCWCLAEAHPNYTKPLAFRQDRVNGGCWGLIRLLGHEIMSDSIGSVLLLTCLHSSFSSILSCCGFSTIFSSAQDWTVTICFQFPEWQAP